MMLERKQKRKRIWTYALKIAVYVRWTHKSLNATAHWHRCNYNTLQLDAIYVLIPELQPGSARSWIIQSFIHYFKLCSGLPTAFGKCITSWYFIRSCYSIYRSLKISLTESSSSSWTKMQYFGCIFVYFSTTQSYSFFQISLPFPTVFPRTLR